MPAMARVAELLKEREEELVEGWLNELQSNAQYRQELLTQKELRAYSVQLIRLLREALASGRSEPQAEDPAWRPVREHLNDVLRHWSDVGFKPAEVGAYVLLLKRPLFALRVEQGEAARDLLADDLWMMSVMADRLAMWTIEAYQRRLQELIARQQEELLELSTPVVELWDSVLALPLIGTLDSARTQVVMESLLEKIVETDATVAIIDITGVPTVDTMVAQHLLKAVTAAGLMGASCIISGIRPSIAQTMVQLGVDMRDVTTKSTLADAFTVALDRIGMRVSPQAGLT